MKRANFLQTIDQLHARLTHLTNSKGEEYKGAEDNQFGNFERGGRELGLTREQVLMVYLSKHLDSIRTHVRDDAANFARVYSESIGGRIDDAILYLLLLRGMMVKPDADMADMKAFEANLDVPAVEFDPEQLGTNLKLSPKYANAYAPPLSGAEVGATIASIGALYRTAHSTITGDRGGASNRELLHMMLSIMVTHYGWGNILVFAGPSAPEVHTAITDMLPGNEFSRGRQMLGSVDQMRGMPHGGKAVLIARRFEGAMDPDENTWREVGQFALERGYALASVILDPLCNKGAVYGEGFPA